LDQVAKADEPEDFRPQAGVHQSTVSRIMRGDFKYGRADIRRRIILFIA
jgi:hypothetical protein